MLMPTSPKITIAVTSTTLRMSSMSVLRILLALLSCMPKWLGPFLDAKKAKKLANTNNHNGQCVRQVSWLPDSSGYSGRTAADLHRAFLLISLAFVYG